MKKFPGKITMEVILQKHYFVEGFEEQGKNNKGEDLPPKLVKLDPVLGRGLAADQEAF
jgi:hypothetical protein